MTTKHITEDEIQAYIDGQLGAEDYKRVEQYLLNNPADAKRVAEYDQINDAFRTNFDAQLDSTIAARFSENIFQQNKTARYNLTSLAAGIMLFVFGAASNWMYQEKFQEPVAVNNNINFATQALYAHAVYTPEKRHPVEVTAKQEKHLVKWLSKRLKGKVKIPNLNSLGFELVGGRLLPAKGQAAAQFMYEDQNKQRLTLYIKKNRDLSETSGFKILKQDNTNSFYWIDENFGYVLIGNISKQKLTETAFKVYSLLSDDTLI